MSRNLLPLALAGCLGFLATGSARAQIVLGSTSFTGTTTNFSAVGNTNLPYVDANGTQFTMTVFGQVFSGVGMVIFGSGPSLTPTLGSSATQVGFSLPTNISALITGVSVNNGDPARTGLSLSASNSFLSISDSNPFTAVTITFGGPSTTFVVGDFRIATTAVPEPTSLPSGGVLAAAAGLVVFRRRRRTGFGS